MLSAPFGSRGLVAVGSLPLGGSSKLASTRFALWSVSSGASDWTWFALLLSVERDNPTNLTCGARLVRVKGCRANHDQVHEHQRYVGLWALLWVFCSKKVFAIYW